MGCGASISGYVDNITEEDTVTKCLRPFVKDTSYLARDTCKGCGSQNVVEELTGSPDFCKKCFKRRLKYKCEVCDIHDTIQPNSRLRNCDGTGTRVCESCISQGHLTKSSVDTKSCERCRLPRHLITRRDKQLCLQCWMTGGSTSSLSLEDKMEPEKPRKSPVAVPMPLADPVDLSELETGSQSESTEWEVVADRPRASWKRGKEQARLRSQKRQEQEEEDARQEELDEGLIIEPPTPKWKLPNLRPFRLKKVYEQRGAEQTNERRVDLLSSLQRSASNPKLDQAKMCPHCQLELRPSKTPEDDWDCSVCHKPVKKGTMLFCCGRCDYDECKTCYVKPAKLVKHSEGGW